MVVYFNIMHNHFYLINWNSFGLSDVARTTYGYSYTTKNTYTDDVHNFKPKRKKVVK